MQEFKNFNFDNYIPERTSHRKNSDKYQWPEAVGKEGFQAERIIKADNYELQTEVIESGIPVTPDFQVQRVRILLNEQGKVKDIPRIG